MFEVAALDRVEAVVVGKRSMTTDIAMIPKVRGGWHTRTKITRKHPAFMLTQNHTQRSQGERTFGPWLIPLSVDSNGREYPDELKRVCSGRNFVLQLPCVVQCRAVAPCIGLEMDVHIHQRGRI